MLRKALKFIDVPPAWLLLFAVAAWWIGQWLPLPLGAGLRGLGTAMVWAGVILIGLAAMQFARHRTTIIPGHKATHLLTSGVFAWSRNPIYLADAIILAGLCLRWDAAPALVLLPVFVTLIRRRFIEKEEKFLRTEFPDAFAVYERKTHRWV